MTHRLIRLAYALEFLVALMAVFTAWSEIGGQDALDLMHWGWKLGFSFTLSFALVAYTSTLVSQDAIWSFGAVRWLTVIVLILIAMGVVTYYYSLQERLSDSDETGNISSLSMVCTAHEFVA